MSAEPIASHNLPDTEFWIDDQTHRNWLSRDARRQFTFFQASVRPEGGFFLLDHSGVARADTIQELHTATRLVHSYALGKMAGVPGCDNLIDHGMRYILSHHHDREHGGYVWALDGDVVHDGRKLAYGHVFVLLAAASARMAGHPDADALIDDVTEVLNTRFWEDDYGLFADEWNRDWTPFSDYRGMNANMHGVEALLTAFEATGRPFYLEQAGRILEFFMGDMAPRHDWRLPEHYNANWQVNPDYRENPMFRPAGTTPGHSFELARLLLQHWDLSGRSDETAPRTVRRVVERALADAWSNAQGGLVYTLDTAGNPDIRDRYWWPVTEAIGALATLIKLERRPDDEAWYRRLWTFAQAHFVDDQLGGWFPEINEHGVPVEDQFHGKPDIYHAVQADLFALAPGISRFADDLRMR